MIAEAREPGARREVLLWAAQRGSALVLAVCVVVHLATMILAVRGGLTAGEILGRLHGSTAWLVFYLAFTASVAVHAPIGLRAILAEMLGWRGRLVDLALLMFGVFLAVAGGRAVAGLVL
jgi:fumarate reductase subunit C